MYTLLLCGEVNTTQKHANNESSVIKCSNSNTQPHTPALNNDHKAKRNIQVISKTVGYCLQQQNVHTANAAMLRDQLQRTFKQEDKEHSGKNVGKGII